jgi:glycosyltransferase involved in cell wall biosynthesis
MDPKRILFVVNHSEFFFSHRLPFALAAQKNGFDVHVATSPSGLEEKYLKHGFEWHKIDSMEPGGQNPLMEMKLLYELYNLYSNLKPDLIHHVTIKPVMYGGIAARWAKIIGVVNALSGLGYLFRSNTKSARFLQVPIFFLLKYSLNHPNSILLLQNQDDASLFIKRGIATKEKIAVIRGSGVDLTKFFPSEENNNTPPIILLASRMLWDKGVGEFVEAADKVNSGEQKARFVLVGKPDKNNPKSIERKQLEKWNETGMIEWWGFHEDMPQVLQNSDIVVLPSYYEGVPKVLIEAAACGKPIITTNVPGCREIVKDGYNGYLVEEKNSKDLADKALTLLADKKERIEMGEKGRKFASEHFSLKSTKERTLALYRSLLSI